MSLNRPQDRVVGVGVAGSGFDSQVPAPSSGWSAGGRSSVIHTKGGGGKGPSTVGHHGLTLT